MIDNESRGASGSRKGRFFYLLFDVKLSGIGDGVSDHDAISRDPRSWRVPRQELATRSLTGYCAMTIHIPPDMETGNQRWSGPKGRVSTLSMHPTGTLMKAKL